VDEITYKNGYYTMVASSHKHRTLADSITTFSQTGLVGGVILLMSAMTDDIKNILNHTKIPVILIGGGKEEKDFDTVAIDNYEGAFNATEYLIKKKGFKKIAHITGPSEKKDLLMPAKKMVSASINLLSSMEILQ
jgi:LacI family transcriptional regulator